MSKRKGSKTPPIISVRHLYVVYNKGRSNEVRALSDISFEVFPGEFIIFFGPSGCGKSTLLYSISGLEKNISGSIRVQGAELTSFDAKARAHFHQTVIGMVFQAYYLISSLTILENVALPQMSLSEKKRNREKKAKILLQHFGVHEQSHKLPNELSGGQQQRVAICRALMNDPDIIVADEPVGNLDSKSSEDVMKLLRALNDDQKKTVILVTHDPSHLHHAHRIIYLRDGVIAGIKKNTPEERRESAVKSIAQANLPLALRHWAKTITSEMLQNSSSIYLTIKAQEIAIEALTGMTLEELQIIEKVICDILQEKKIGIQEMYNTLHGALEKHGLALEKRRAMHLARQLALVAKEVAKIQHLEKKNATLRRASFMREAARIRFLALQSINKTIPAKSHRIIDRSIMLRMQGKISFTQLYNSLDLPIHKGGAGLDRRLARKLARAIEPLASMQHIEKVSNSLNAPTLSS